MSGPTDALTEWQIFENGTPKTPTSIAITAFILDLTFTVDPADDPTRLVYSRGPRLYLGTANAALADFDLSVPFP